MIAILHAADQTLTHVGGEGVCGRGKGPRSSWRFRPESLRVGAAWKRANREERAVTQMPATAASIAASAVFTNSLGWMRTNLVLVEEDNV